MCCAGSKIIFVVAWCSLFVAGLFLFYFLKSRHHFILLQAQAIKRGGTVGSHALIFPKLIFHWQNYQITSFITLPAKTNPTFVVVSVAVHPIKPCGFVVERRNPWIPGMNIVFGSKKILTGSLIFDQEFTVFRRGDEDLGPILDPQAQEMLLTIKAQNPLISLEKNVLTIRAPHSAHNAQEIDALIDLTIVFLQRLKDLSFII